ncbi:type IV-A pilus assembly ATPase PilB, partial [Stutzerimonas stutzeri]
MSENTSLSGLARQMVAAGVLDERAAQQAQAQAIRGKTPFVTYVVQNRLAKGRVIAELASEQFGVALLDLAALDKESLPKELVSEKLAKQHRVLPLSKRGSKLYIAVSDPANHQSIADIQFSTGLSIEPVLVEDDKLGEAIDKLYDS